MCIIHTFLPPERMFAMKAAVVRALGAAPVLADVPEPAPANGEVVIHMTAAALSPVTRSRASGAHYSSCGRFPFVAGIDGVGRLDDGRRVYVFLPTPPHGAMAERTVTKAANLIPVPDGLDDVTAAALANPGMSSWMALTERARFHPGETVLINGATGSAGRLAVQIARAMGAGRVIATGRNPEVLTDLSGLGADVVVPLTGDGLDGRFQDVMADGVDVVLDYLWGPYAEQLLIAAARAGPEGRAVRFVQIGSASGGDITLPSAVLRSSSIELTGSGLGSVPLERLPKAVEALFQAAAANGFRIATQAVPLTQVEEAWGAPEDGRRIVFTMDAG